MSERLKLKRGLSDISPLFAKEVLSRPRARVVRPIRETVSMASMTTPEICFVWSADDEGDAPFLNNFFASKTATEQSGAVLMTLSDEGDVFHDKATRTERWSRSLRRIHLPVNRVSEAFLSSDWMSDDLSRNPEAQIFLDVTIKNLIRHSDLVRTLDHVVLFLKPQVDSVTEAYRQLKRLIALGLTAEVTVLFDADDAGGLPARLYELFSDFVSRHQSLSLGYLGTLHLSQSGEGLRQDIRWDSWNQSRLMRSSSIEKMHFLAWVEKLQVIEGNR